MWRWIRELWNRLGSIGRSTRVDMDAFSERLEQRSNNIQTENDRIAEELVFAMDAAQMGEWDLDFLNDRVHRSLRYDQIFGYPVLQPEWCWHDFMKHVSPEDQYAVTEKFQRTIREGGTFVIDCRIIWPDQSKHWISVRGRAFLNDQGVPVRMAGVVMDISERMWTEERLQASMDSAPTAIAMVDDKGTVILVNREAERIFGYARNELVGQVVEVLVPERFRANHPKLRAGFIADPSIRRMGGGQDLFCVRKDGSEFSVEIGLTPINTTEGVFVLAGIVDISERFQIAERLSRSQRLAALNLAQDAEEARRRAESNEEAIAIANRSLTHEITQRQRTEEEMRRTSIELARSNTELEQFAYIASHDLQEPLRKVQSFGDLLVVKAGARLGEEELDYLKRMQASANRMQVLVNDLLAFARIASQAKPFVPVDLNNIIRDVLSDLEIRVKSSGGRVEVGSLSCLDSDPLQMRQLLQNMISNALKFHRPNVPPVIVVSSKNLKSRVLNHQASAADSRSQVCEITIRDNGIGFDVKYLDRIFLPFQRLHGRTEFEGTGMGLAICRKIVERHGGNITARSIPGEGSTFIISLPLHQLKSNEPPPMSR